MKKIISLLISTLLLLFATGINAFASASEPSEIAEEIVYFEDGSYIETTIVIEEKGFSTYATKTVSGNKKIVFKNSDGVTQWSATLNGTYTYTGSSSTCTAASVSYTIENNKWKITTASASKSGNKAIGNVVAKRYTFGIPVQTLEETITMTCSATGALS